MHRDPTRPKRDPRPFQKTNGFWYITFNQRGKSPKWVATGVRSLHRTTQRQVPREVREMLVDWARLWRDDAFDPWCENAPRRRSVEDAIAAYLVHRASTTTSPETLKGLRTTLEAFARTLTPALALDQITPAHVRSFVTRVDLSASSRCAYYNRLRTFFRYGLTQRWLYEDPTDAVTRPREPSTSRSIFLPGEFNCIVEAARLDAARRPQRAVCAEAYTLAVCTGLRLSELCSRTWADFDTERNVLRVDAQTACGFRLKSPASRRVIPLFPRAAEVLQRRRSLRISEDPEEPILLAPRRRGRWFMTPDWLSKRFSEHRRQAGLQVGSFHSLRHSFITYVLALGVPESKVMAMVGHTKYDTVRRYTHMVEALLQEAPAAALARYLPGYEPERKPRVLREMAAFLAGSASGEGA